MSEDLCTLVALLALACITGRAGILASYNIFGEAPTTRDILEFFSMLHIHVVPQVVSMDADLLTLVAFVAWACGSSSIGLLEEAPTRGIT